MTREVIDDDGNTFYYSIANNGHERTSCEALGNIGGIVNMVIIIGVRR